MGKLSFGATGLSYQPDAVKVKTGGAPICTRCAHRVFFMEQVLANGKAWHKHCYSCVRCTKPLDSTNVCAHEEEIYCKPCHTREFGTRGYGYAGGAAGLSTDAGTGISRKPTASPNTMSPKPPPKSPYMSKRIVKTIYTFEHVPIADICPRCNARVYQAEEVKANGKAYHELCFKCVTCNKMLERGRTNEHKGELYCNSCYAQNFGIKGYGFACGNGSLLSTPPKKSSSMSNVSLTPSFSPNMDFVFDNVYSPGPPSSRGVSPGPYVGSGSNRETLPGPYNGSGSNRGISPGPYNGSGSNHGTSPGTYNGSGSNHGISPIPYNGSGSNHRMSPIPYNGSGSNRGLSPGPYNGSGSSRGPSPVPYSGSNRGTSPGPYNSSGHNRSISPGPHNGYSSICGSSPRPYRKNYTSPGSNCATSPGPYTGSHAARSPTSLNNDIVSYVGGSSGPLYGHVVSKVRRPSANQPPSYSSHDNSFSGSSRETSPVNSHYQPLPGATIQHNGKNEYMIAHHTATPAPTSGMFQCIPNYRKNAQYI